MRYNRYAAATVSGTLAPGVSLGDGIAAFDAVAAATLDERFTTALTGAARDFAESSSSLGCVFALALLLIYLVLAAQFESFRDPLVILLTVPLALAGALLALWYFGQTLNVFSQIGLVMLIGLVAKNGILIVEFAKQRRAAGVSEPRRGRARGSRRALAADSHDDARDRARRAARSRWPWAPARKAAPRWASPSSAGSRSAAHSRCS